MMFFLASLMKCHLKEKSLKRPWNKSSTFHQTAISIIKCHEPLINKAKIDSTTAW